MYIFLLIILSLVLRLTYVIKPEGFWNDEYVSWFISAIPFKDGFFQEILKQCHMPLYYLYLKPFSGYSDLVLRLTSIIPSVLAVPVMYFLGRQYSPKIGKFAASITAVLPFLVYYSQEVRFYSLVFLFSAIILYLSVKIINGNNIKYRILFVITALLLIFTHVLGIFFVIPLSVYLLYKKRILNIKYILILGFITALVVPFGFNIFKQIPSSQWWGVFSYTNILFLFSDFLSPILSNNVNAPPVFYYNKNILFVILITLPTIIGFCGIISGYKKLRGFILVSIVNVIIIVALSLVGKLVFITKYMIEILPIIILAVSTGYEKGKLKNILFYILVVINLLAIVTPYYPSKIFRSEGHNLPAIVLNKQNSDYIIYTYYAPDRFFRYVKTNSVTNHISKINRFDYLPNPERIMADISKGKKVSIVFLDSVSFIPDDMIEKAEKNNLPEMFITFSIIRHSLEKYFVKNYTDITLSKAGSWIILSGVKK